jgi:hypothetical protein
MLTTSKQLIQSDFSIRNGFPRLGEFSVSVSDLNDQNWPSIDQMPLRMTKPESSHFALLDLNNEYWELESNFIELPLSSASEWSNSDLESLNNDEFVAGTSWFEEWAQPISEITTLDPLPLCGGFHSKKEAYDYGQEWASEHGYALKTRTVKKDKHDRRKSVR